MVFKNNLEQGVLGGLCSDVSAQLTGPVASSAPYTAPETSMPHPFHLALPVHDLALARAFYGDHLGCSEGRSALRWVDYDFFGHQLSLHLSADSGVRIYTPVDGHAVPVPHFGVVLPWDDWHALARRLKSRGQAFIIEPTTRFAGQVGEQATMFFMDPSGNALEFKSFEDPTQVFAT